MRWQGDDRSTHHVQKSPCFYFSLHCAIAFSVYFLAGMLVVFLDGHAETSCWKIVFPPLLDEIFAAEITTGAGLLSCLQFALFLALPPFMLFMLGLRTYDFFCLSRFWNILFCAAHGVICCRFWVSVTENASQRADVALIRWMTVIIPVFCLLWIVYVHRLLLQINRTAAIGVSLPHLLGGQRVSYPHGDEQLRLQERLGCYLRKLITLTLKIYAADALLLLLCFGFQKMMQS